MWRRRSLRRSHWPPRLCEALETWAGVLLAVGTALLLYATLKAQLARADEFPADVGAPTLLFQGGPGDFDAAAPLATDVRISVAGVVARVRVAQRFRNPGTSWAEAVYVLPLPDDAAVDRLLMQIGDRFIEGEIHEREQAERVYGAARSAGQRASLVRQTSANLFTTAVANIGPGEAVDITIEYLQTARYDAGEFSLRLPMTLTPRYGALDTPEAQSAASSAVLPEPPVTIGPVMAAAARGTAAHEANVRAVLAPGMPLADAGSRGHELRVRREADLYVLEAGNARVPMDRDLVLTWRPQLGAAPTVAALTETRGDTTYALLMLLPPAAAHTTPAPPREQIYVIDTSGSMGGQSIEQARAALSDALGRLTAADRFNVLQFNSVTSSLFAAPVPFTAATQAEALRYVRGLEVTGGTEIETAIRAALAQSATDGYLRQVIFITDGAVGAETALFGAIKRELGDARLFTIGIGSAPNSYFMRKAAQFGRGTYTHIGSTSEVAAKMQALFAKLEHVALADVLVDWPAAVELYPNQMPDLYAGEPLVVAASFPAERGRPLRTQAFGKAGGAPWRQAVTATPSELPGIATLWARRKIEHLLDSRVDGVDENLIRALVVQTALEHHLVSPYTSLVAVDKTPARTATAELERRAVANAVPAGAQWTTTMPATATAAPLYRWAGLVVLLVAAGAALRRRGLAV